MAIDDDSDVGYAVEVDLEYPEELHDLHNSLRLPPKDLRSPKKCCHLRPFIRNEILNRLKNWYKFT